jgi:uncharacterized membrane protein YjjB (DUF3815 family)
LAPHLLIETAILAALGLVVRITFHGLLHGLLEPTWTAYQVLIAACAVTWLAVRYYRRKRAHLHLPAVAEVIMGTVIQFPGTWYPNALLELMKRKGRTTSRQPPFPGKKTHIGVLEAWPPLS